MSREDETRSCECIDVPPGRDAKMHERWLHWRIENLRLSLTAETGVRHVAVIETSTTACGPLGLPRITAVATYAPDPTTPAPEPWELTAGKHCLTASGR